MANSESPLTVVVATGAAGELDEIWQRTFAHRGLRQADAYKELLDREIKRLATDYPGGRAVEGFEALRAITVRWSRARGADGHILIYEVD